MAELNKDQKLHLEEWKKQLVYLQSDEYIHHYPLESVDKIESTRDYREKVVKSLIAGLS